jgi:hypothetical protein
MIATRQQQPYGDGTHFEVTGTTWDGVEAFRPVFTAADSAEEAIRNVLRRLRERGW